MVMDRTHIAKKQHINHKTCFNMEPARKEEERKAQNHLEKNHRAGDEGTRTVMATAGAEGTRPKGMEEPHQWPMFLWEFKGLK